MIHSLQYVYATVADSLTIPHVLTAFHSLRSLYQKSVLYLLCTQDDVYTLLEDMEYDDIYIIALGELQEHYPILYEICEKTTPKKYESILHAFLLHYILYYNPLIYAVQYIDPYTYWIRPVYQQHTEGCSIYVSSPHLLPYYISCPNIPQYKEMLLEYQHLCIMYALDMSRAYTQGSLHLPFDTLVNLYNNNIQRCPQYTLLFTQKREDIIEKNSILSLANKVVVGLYTRYLLFSRFMFSCCTLLSSTYRSRCILMKHIACYRKEFMRVYAKCKLFGLSLPPLSHVNSRYFNSPSYFFKGNM